MSIFTKHELKSFKKRKKVCMGEKEIKIYIKKLLVKSPQQSKGYIEEQSYRRV